MDSSRTGRFRRPIRSRHDAERVPSTKVAPFPRFYRLGRISYAGCVGDIAISLADAERGRKLVDSISKVYDKVFSAPPFL
jgi:hypothetical protein